MKSFFKIAVIATLVLFINACKKNTTGGKTKIAIYPAHHGKQIKGATVYVKFNATDMPSNPTSNYNMVVVGDTDEEHVHIEGLRYGKYYFYVVGFDPEINETVVGGAPLTIKWKDRKEDIHFDVAVSED